MQKQRGQPGHGGCAGNGLGSAEWEQEARVGGGEEAERQHRCKRALSVAPGQKAHWFIYPRICYNLNIYI